MTSADKDEVAPQKWHQKQGFIPCGELTGINLPETDVPEVFFQKRIRNDHLQEKLKEFPLV